jgi:hypothetical protein
MKKKCLDVQEKLATGIDLLEPESQHLSDCQNCQNVFADYLALTALIEQDANDIFVPDSFLENIMSEVANISQRQDWFEMMVAKVNIWLQIPLVEYGYLATGFVFGVVSFFRFVAFVFIPA